MKFYIDAVNNIEFVSKLAHSSERLVELSQCLQKEVKKFKI
jgi:hypothetical protein